MTPAGPSDPSGPSGPPAEVPLQVAGYARTRVLAGETVVLDLRTERYFGLDGAGSDLWALLREGASLTDAVDRLADVYDVDRDVLESDLRDLVAVLLDRGLVTSEPPPDDATFGLADVVPTLPQRRPVPPGARPGAFA